MRGPRFPQYVEFEVFWNSEGIKGGERKGSWKGVTGPLGSRSFPIRGKHQKIRLH